MTALFISLALASLVLSISGYVLLHQLQTTPFPLSVPLATLSGRLPSAATLAATDLERFGYVADALPRGEFRLRPPNHWEQLQGGGLSANPYDFVTLACLTVHEERWTLHARILTGPPLALGVLSAWFVIESGGSVHAVVWTVLVAAWLSFRTWQFRAPYLRLQGQLNRLGE